MLLVEFTNPFDFGEREIRHHCVPRTLRELVPADRQSPFVVMHNGDAVLEADWDRVADGGDIVSVVHLPAGGGGGKDVLRTTLMIVLVIATSVFTAGLSASLLASGAFATATGAAAAAAFIKAGIVVAGSMLVNALIPPSSPSTAIQQAGAPNIDNSPTYSLSASGNQARLGQAIPVQYGRVKIYPDYGAQPWTTYEHDNSQWLHQLFILGHGEFDVEAILINDRDIDEYSDVSYWTYGPTQHPTLFPTQVYNAPGLGSVEIPPDGTQTVGVIAHPAGTTLQTIHVDCVAPRGLFRIYPENPPQHAYDIVYVNIEIMGRWVDGTGAPLSGWQSLHRWPGQYKTQSPWRMTFYAFVGDWPGTWDRIEVAVRRFDAQPQDPQVFDDVYWEGMRAFVSEDTSGTLYEGTTKIAIRIKASDRLTSQAAQRIGVICTRRIPTWDGNAWSSPQASSSMAWALHDALVNADYGPGIDAARIDLAGLAYLDGLGLRFDGRFDQPATVWEILSVISRAGRCQPYSQGGVIRFARDEAGKSPVAMFSERNIVAGTLSIDYSIPDASTPDAVKVLYWDDTVWTQRAVAVRYDGVEISPDDVEVAVTLFGVTQRDVAFAEAWYLARTNRYRRRFVSFATEMEGFLPSVGDLISLSHEMPSWGQAMEIVEWTQGTLTARLSDEPDWSGAGPMRVGLRRPDGTLNGPIDATQGATAREIVLDDPPDFTPLTLDDRERTHVVLGRSNNWSRAAIVLETRPKGGVQVEVNCVIDDTRPLDAPPPTPGPPPIYGECLDPVVADLYLSAVPQTTDMVSASWNGPGCVSYYEVEYAEDIVSAPWIQVGSTEFQTISFQSRFSWNIKVRVRAVGTNHGLWTIAAMSDMPDDGNPQIGPAAPTNIVATGLIGGVLLEWENTVGAVSVRIWRAPGEGAGMGQLALLEVVANASRYTDLQFASNDLGNVHSYVLESINAQNVVGPASGAVTATPEQYAADIIDTIKGQIDEAWLTASLNARLDLIDADGDGLVDLVDGLQIDVASLYQGLDLLRGSLPYDPTIDYKAGEYCQYSGILYVALRDMSAPAPIPPGQTGDWAPVGAYISLGAAVAAQAAEITTLRFDVDTNTGAISGLASQVDALTLQIGSVNMLTGPDFGLDDPWQYQGNLAGFSLQLVGYHDPSNLFVDHCLRTSDDSGERTAILNATALTDNPSLFADAYQRGMPVVPGQRYQFSAYLGVERCAGKIILAYYDSNDQFIGGAGEVSDTVLPSDATGGPDLSDFQRVHVFDTAPGNAHTAVVIIRCFYDPSLGGSQTLPVLAAVRPLFGEATQDQTEPSPWVNNVSGYAGALQSLTVRVVVNEDGIFANSQAITALQNDLSDAEAGITANANAISLLDTRVSATEGGVTANASDITVLQGTVNDENNGVAANAAAIDSLQITVSSHDGEIDALASEQLTLIAASGANLARDPIFQFDTGWKFFKDGASDFTLSYVTWPSSAWALDGYEGERTALISASNLYAGYYGNIYQDQIPVVPGRWYQFSVYVGIHRCMARLFAIWYDENGATLATSGYGTTATTGGFGGPSLDDFVRLWFVAEAPAGATTVAIYVRADFQTTESLPRLFVARPMVATADEDQTEPADWKPGDQSPIVAALQREGMVWVDDGGGGGIYTVKIEVDDAGSLQQVGFGMSVLKEQGNWVSDFRINANRFAIMDPSIGDPSADYPFIVDSGVVYISDAKIKNASIDNAKIANLTLTAGKIADNATSISTYYEHVRAYLSSEILIQIPMYLGGGNGDETKELMIVMNAFLEKGFTSQRCEVNLFMQLQGSGQIFNQRYSVEVDERYGNHPLIRRYQIPAGVYRYGNQNIRMWATPVVSTAYFYASILVLGLKK